MTDNLEDALSEAAGLTIDFSGTSEDFENLPEGRYVTTITKAGPGKSAAGNSVLKVSYGVTEGDHTGRYAFSSTNVDGKAAWKTRKMLKGLGVLVEGKRFRLDPADLVGIEVIIVIDDEGWVTDWTPVAASGNLE